MDKIDKKVLNIIADNNVLFETLKKLLLDEFEIEAPQTDLGVTDEVLGQIFRARLVGKNKVENAFKKIATYKTFTPEKEVINEAR